MLTALATLAMVAAAGSGRGWAAEAWKAYDYPDAGFAVYFPAEPKQAQATYTTLSGASAPARSWSVTQDGVVYTVTVADFSRLAGERDKAIDNAVRLAGRSGEIKLDVEARINTQYGHELSMAGPDGSRSILAIFFFNNRLYQLDGKALAPNAEAGSARLIRFQQSLQFIEP